VLLDRVGQVRLTVNSSSRRARSLTEPATSPDVTGGSALTTGICDTPYSRRMLIAVRIVSPGWVCTSAGRRPPLLFRTSPTVVSPSALRKP
jgi:hypothetical protein